MKHPKKKAEELIQRHGEKALEVVNMILEELRKEQDITIKEGCATVHMLGLKNLDQIYYYEDVKEELLKD